MQTSVNLNFCNWKNTQEVINQPLWYNELIQIDKKFVKYDTWQKAGIKKVYHILDNGGRILNKIQLEEKYDINIKQHEYNSLIHSIPATWKKLIKNDTDILRIIVDNKCKIIIEGRYSNIEDTSTKEIYTHILEKNKCKMPTSKNRWIELHDEMDHDENCWQLIYETPFQLTNNAKILIVQYKIVHRILAVNHNFKKWDRIESSKCEICGIDKETIEHFIMNVPTQKHFGML